MKKRKGKGLRILGWTISLGLVSLITVIVFTKAIGEIFGDWFSDNAMWIAIASGILVLIFIITGVLKIRSVVRKGKKLF